MEDLSGMDLGRYHILEQLGEGGMATVYKAYDTRLERDVAVKVLRTDLFGQAMLERILKRFEREAKALARLTHPNIVHVNDYGEQEGMPYLVMDYLPGGTLKGRLGKPMPWQEAVRILLPIAQALDYAHEENILHRDVKPSNILLTAKGQPMLTDFGIAKILDLEDGQTLTGAGVGIGTPEYMSPEQALGKPVDGRTDVYSLGVVLYELVTGRKPYTADTPMAVVDKHLHDPLPRPGEFVPGLPEGVEKLLFKALAKRPGDRYESMDAFAKALEGLLMVTGIQPVKVREPKKKNPPEARLPEKPRDDQLAQVEPRQPARPVRPIPRRFWVIGSIIFGVAVIGLLAGWFLNKPAVFFPTHTTSDTHIPTDTQTPTNTLYPSSTVTPASTLTPVNTAISTMAPLSTMNIQNPHIGSTWTRPADGMAMVYVPAGEFTMGSAAGTGWDDEHPQHTVYLDAFWIDKMDVTNAMYRWCVQFNTCQPPQSIVSYSRISYFGNSQYYNYPVINVDWSQADTYCKWAGARLPTEAEWEKAARGTDGRTYPWGNDSPTCSLANYSGCTGDTSAVDAHAPGASPYGALDMAGNVLEWVNDWYDGNYYASSPQRYPQGPSSGTYRVLRGGSWVNLDLNVRTASRDEVSPTESNYYVGFRCVLSP